MTMTTRMSRTSVVGRTGGGFLRGINIHHHPQLQHQHQINFDPEAPAPPTPPPMPQQTMHFLEKPEVDKKVKV